MAYSTPEGRRSNWRRWYYRHHDELLKRNKIRAADNRAFVDSFKKPCARCGYEDKRALQFHHVRGKKEKSVALLSIAGYSKERILKEINLCIVLCANCHQIEHLENGYKNEHK